MYGRDILGPETNGMEKRPYPLRIHGTNGIFTYMKTISQMMPNVW